MKLILLNKAKEFVLLLSSYPNLKHLQVIKISNFFEVPLSFVRSDGIQISCLLSG